MSDVSVVIPSPVASRRHRLSRRRAVASALPLLIAGLSGCAPAASRPAEVSAHGAWARAADSGAVTAVYLTIVNGTRAVVTLRGVASSAAESVSPHETMQMSGMVHMMPLADSLPIAAGDSLVFAEGAKHLMVNGLRRKLAAGDSLVLTLTFDGGRTLDVRAAVRTP